MSHMSLEAYFRINFALMQYHKYSLTEIENRRVAVESTYWNYREQELEVEELLEKGSAIPDVSFRQGREEIHLKDLLGKRFILAFYPAAFTGG